jgi:hypothetical protein
MTDSQSLVTAEPTSLGFSLGPCDVPTSFAEQMQAAEVLAKAGVMVPRQLRNQSGAVFAMMTYARALNLPIGVAMQHLYVFEDKEENTHIEMSARLMGALVRRAGHKIVPVSENASRIVLQLKRCDDPTPTYFADYTRKDVELAGLLSKFGHMKYPRDMLFARCLSRLTRRWCSEATMGAYLIGEVSEGGPEAVEDTSAVEAGELYAAATRATSVAEIKALGDKARYQGLLPVYLDGEPLERRLWVLLRAQMSTEGVRIVDGEIVPEQAAQAPERPVADSAPAEESATAACGCTIAQAATHGSKPCPFRFADDEVEL